MAAALLQRDALDSPSQTNPAQTGAGGAPLYPRRWRNPRHDPRRHACFNLNAINHRTDEAGDGTPYPTDVFVRLLALLGEPPLRASQIAAALGDWTDSDGQQRLNGAEDEVYMAQTRAISPPTSRCRMSASCACWPGWTPRSISACSPSSASSRMTRCRSMSTPCAPPSRPAGGPLSRRSDAAGGATAAAQPPANRVEQRRRLSRAADAAENRYHACPSRLTVHSARFIAAFTLVTGNLRFQLHSVLQQEGRTFTVVQRRYGLSMVVDEQD